MAAARGNALARPRLVRAPAHETARRFQVEPLPRGAFTGLKAHAMEAPMVSDRADAVALRVVAIGVNFRDVLNVLGMYPGDPGPPGADCAGVVVNVAASAPRPFRLGESVFGLAPGCLGSHARTSVYAAARKPGVVAYAAAATAPTVFVTVDMALTRATTTTADAHVLVQAASGGVGLAALEVLRAIGARVVGTGSLLVNFDRLVASNFVCSDEGWWAYMIL